jgi:lysophospholipase L1-like esterase
MKKISLRNLAKNIGVAFASLLFTLLLLELLARGLHLGTGAFWEPHELYGWRNIPNASGWESCYGECEVYVEINSKGLRDKEIPYENEADLPRIVLLGDSMTAAMQVPLEDTFGKVLENNLNEAGSGVEWETINAGVNAFGTDNELLFYRLEANKYQPDFVILVIYLANDIYNNSYILEQRYGGQGHKPYFLLSEEGELELQNFPVAGTDSFTVKIGTYLKKHFQLPRFVAQTLNLRGEVPNWLRSIISLFSGNRGAVQSNASESADKNEGNSQTEGQLPPRRPDICDAEYLPVVEEAWDVTEAIISQLRTEVEADGAQLLVLSIPAAPQITPPKDGETWYCERPNEILNNYLEEQGIQYLDLLPAFKEYSLAGGEPLYFERDFHINVNGHHLAGELLSDFFKETVIEK